MRSVKIIPCYISRLSQFVEFDDKTAPFLIDTDYRAVAESGVVNACSDTKPGCLRLRGRRCSLDIPVGFAHQFVGDLADTVVVVNTDLVQEP